MTNLNNDDNQIEHSEDAYSQLKRKEVMGKKIRNGVILALFFIVFIVILMFVAKV